jgi:Zn-dependent protease with chaperone function
MTTTPYPPNPQQVPRELTAPSAQYKRHAWLAMAALLFFVAAYGGLSFWFGWKAWKLMALAAGGARDGWLLGLMGLASGFLALFMVKALFFVNRGGQPDALEITAAEQPVLFDFLARLARDTGAPTPARVFVSPRVNAAVFYDLNLLNLVFPSRKNLEIGLPLVNVLTLCELKAVLAHEFGHFAQRTMAVGRWVYIAQQIAGYLISKRDALDRFLNGLSRMDLGLAWIGWIPSLIVWSIRSLAESGFRLVVLAQRALSREMELQADLVAVSVTGSEALINALHRLGAADAAWDRAIGFANGQLEKGHTTRDLLAIQSRVLDNLRHVLDDPHYGALPPREAESPPAEQRLFKADMAQPSRMWATHPAHHEREENTKRVFVHAELDDTPAWALFQDAPGLRERVTAFMIKHIEKPVEALTLEASLAALDAEYARESFQPRYKGLYLWRPLAAFWREPAEMVARPLPARVGDLGLLYPPGLSARLERQDELRREKVILEALRDGKAKAASGSVSLHRGKELTRKRLPAAIAQVAAELNKLEAELQTHDQACRTMHQAVAQVVGKGWDGCLAGLREVLHYAEHSEADLRDLARVLGNTVQMVTAAGPANKKGANRVIADAEKLHEAMQHIAASRHALKLDAQTAQRLPKVDWNQTLGEFDLGAPYLSNINDWMRVIDGWVGQLVGALQHLRRAALDQLLHTEALLTAAWERDAAAQALIDAGAPAACSVPREYPRLVPGQERKLQSKLPWIARVQIADGPLPMLVRLGAAGGVLACVVGFSGAAMTVPLVVYNGLGRAVAVQVDGQSVTVGAGQRQTLQLDSERDHPLSTKTTDGRLIEAFNVQMGGDAAPKVYNVAAAAAMVEWTAVYGGSGQPPAPRPLGAKRWQSSGVDHLFEEPPPSIRSKHGGQRRTVLTALGSDQPGQSIDAVLNRDEQRAMVLAHAQWDPTEAPATLSWLYAALDIPGIDDVLAKRLAHDANDVLALRVKQDAAKGAEREALCRQIESKAQGAAANVDLRYLAIRCLPESEQRDDQFLQGLAQAPNSGWFAYAAGAVLAGRTQWQQAEATYLTAMRSNPGLAEYVSVEIARMRRLMGNSASAPLKDLAPRSNALRTLLAYETGEGLDNDSPANAYRLLDQGRLDQALATSAAAPEFRRRMLWLVAASQGASAARVGEALNSGAQTAADAGVLFAATALAIREKRDLQPYLQQLERRDARLPDGFASFVELLRTGASSNAIEAGMRRWTAEERGKGYAMAAIALGDAAPAAWKKKARLLLFAAERPYLG